MKVKEFIKLLKTQYVECSSKENPFSISYMKKNLIPDEILDSYVTSIEPLGVLKKSIFSSNAEDGEYVAAVKFEYSSEAPAEQEAETPWEDARQQSTNGQRPQNPFHGSASFPFGIGPIDPDDIISNIVTPEFISQITSSEAFQDLMKPEKIQEALESEEFQEFLEQLSNGSVSFPFPGFGFGGHNQDDEAEGDKEYDEYEAYDIYDDEDETEDEYEVDDYDAYDLYDIDDDDDY